MANRFEKLPIFLSAHSLVLLVYKTTKDFPQDEKYGLVSQIRRSSSSIVANIIEGNARGHKKEHLNFLYIANGSLEETKYHLLLSRDLGYLNDKDYKRLQAHAEEVGKQLRGFISYLAKDE